MIIVNQTNWKEAYEADYTNDETLKMYIQSELFQTDDKGVTLLEKINETHKETSTDGDGLNNGYLKTWKIK